MKKIIILIVLGLTILVTSSVSGEFTQEYKDCINDCNWQYIQCYQDGTDVATCQDEKNYCLGFCN